MWNKYGWRKLGFIVSESIMRSLDGAVGNLKWQTRQPTPLKPLCDFFWSECVYNKGENYLSGLWDSALMRYKQTIQGCSIRSLSIHNIESSKKKKLQTQSHICFMCYGQSLSLNYVTLYDRLQIAFLTNTILNCVFFFNLWICEDFCLLVICKETSQFDPSRGAIFQSGRPSDQHG